MGNRAEKGFALDNIHKLIGQSQNVDINMDTLMAPGFQVIYYKHKPGGNFLIAIEDSTLNIICSSNNEKALLKEKSEGSDRIIIATIEQSNENQEDYDVFPVVASSDEHFVSWLEKLGDRFFRLVDNYSRWSSFTKFLEEDNIYKVNSMKPLQQVPLDYYFLIGRLNDSEDVHHSGHLPPDKGVYVIPDHDLIPVFTSSIYADLYAQEVKNKYGIELQADVLPCVKCYITGSYKSIDSADVSGVILNNQWLLDCYDCNLCDNYSGHFFLNDGDKAYALCGCSELGVKPIWIEKRWDKNEKYFNPKCGMIGW